MIGACRSAAAGPYFGVGSFGSPSTRSPMMLCNTSSVLGPELVADNGRWGTYAWSEFLLGVPGMRVAGGTDEVLHNIIGERVLGLPKDPTPK